MNNEYDAIVIGGGPCGSSAAATLGMRGRRALVLEKDRFPRYHIGESLLPYCYFTLERLGVLDKMRQSSFIKKYSVQFVNMDGKVSQPFYFFQHLDHEAAVTWQVLRSEFDQMLLDNAAEKGAEVRQGYSVKGLLREGDYVVGVWALDESGERHEFRAPMTIDASGRDALTVARSGWRVRDPYLNKIALWTYFKGTKRDEGYDEGATTVAYLPEKGWFWFIPLDNDLTSVGIVAERDYLYRDTRDPAEIFWREVKVNRWAEEHLAPGTQCDDFRVTSEFSYRSLHCAANGLVLAGDAFAFLDPVFSSGVFLALRSGEMAAEEVHAALSDGNFAAERFTNYGEQFRKGLEAMRRLVYVFYDHGFSFGQVIREHPELQGDLTDCLIGNVEHNFDPLFTAINKFAAVPEPLSHGGPLLAASCELSS